MKIFFSLVLACFACLHGLHAQDSAISAKPKIAIFVPLYLDSAFDATNEYRYAKTVFPKFINPGLEFYEGAQLALDSLAKEGSALEVFVFDTRSSKESLENILNKPELADVKLIIAHCSSNEVRQFAEAALKRNIPVINTTIPNDGGVNANPYFVVLNPTLRTQIEGIYKYVQKYHATKQVVVFRKKGPIEDQIKSLVDDYGKSTASVALKIKYVDLIDSFTVSQLKAQLDSNRSTVGIAGTLDAAFGRRLAQQLASISKSYPLTLIGMPTWDGIRDFTKPEFNGLEIVYANPFYNPKSDKISQDITAFFNNTMYARPSDMVFRGYEVTWKFAKLLIRYGNDLSSNLGDKGSKVFTDFDIQPVLDRSSMTLQYFENKKLYFLKWQDGLIKGVN
jgi:hypothetical protein